MNGLELFRRTNNRLSINLASFHSPRSITWSWIIALTREPVAWPRPYARLKVRGTTVPGGHIGLGHLIGLTVYRDNHGWQMSASMLWVSLRWMRQQSMFRRA